MPPLDPARPGRPWRRTGLALAGILGGAGSAARGADLGGRARQGFGGIDWIVLIAYVAVLLGIGFHFSRRQRTTEEYFTGGRHINPVLAGISVFAAYFSIISYIATPGEYVQFGPTLTLLAPLLAMPLYFCIVGWFVIPVIMRLPITSAFELLEARLGLRVRQAGSLCYLSTRFFWMGLILYTSSTILTRMLDLDPRWANVIAAAIGAVTTTYTVIGGIRTVMVTEAVQSSMLMVGALLTIILISRDVGGVGVWFPRHWEAHWPTPPVFSFDPHVRITLVGAFVTSLIGGVCSTVIDQSAVQRLLTTRNAAAARRAYLISNLTILTVLALLSLVGAALLTFFRLHPDALPDRVSAGHNGDLFFPYYISHFLPQGISGMIVASLLAAAMSCLAGGLNSTTTVIMKDFVEIWRKGAQADAGKLRTTRALVVGVGVTAVLTSIVMGAISGNLNEVAGKTVDLLVCPTFGLFFLAIFVKYSTPFGAIWGALYSGAAAAIVGYWDVFTGLPKLSFLWITPVPFAVSLASGCLFSLLPTRGRPRAVLAGYSAAAAVPLLAVLAWLISLRP